MTNPYDAPDSSTLINRSRTVRHSTWLTTLPQILVLVVAITVTSCLIGSRRGLLAGVLIYLAYSAAVRKFIPRDHNAGLKFVDQSNFHAAIESFTVSYEFFGRHLWLDRLRSLLLMTPSIMSYREMALCWTAYCYSQLNDRKQAIAYYKRATEEFPKSAFAYAALESIDSAKDQSIYEAVVN